MCLKQKRNAKEEKESEREKQFGLNGFLREGGLILCRKVSVVLLLHSSRKRLQTLTLWRTGPLFFLQLDE